MKKIVPHWSIKISFVMYILGFMFLDAILCVLTSFALMEWGKSIYNTVMPILFVGYSVICLIVATISFYHNKLKRPIQLITQGAKKIQENDLDFHVVYPVKDEMGEVCRAFEQMRSALQKNQQLVWRQMEERKYLNAAFSHDMRTPLTVLRGYLEMLTAGYQTMSEAELKEEYTVMSKHLERLEQYVESMNQIHKMEDITVKPIQIRSTELVQELEQLSKVMCKKQEKKFEIQAETVSEKISCDLELILQVAGNLVQNAARYANQMVQMKIMESEKEIVIQVQDDGIGFTKKALENGMRPFYTEASGQGEESHLGLGLYTSSFLCRVHGGSLNIETKQQGAGGCVTARFGKKET